MTTQPTFSLSSIASGLTNGLAGLSDATFGQAAAAVADTTQNLPEEEYATFTAKVLTTTYRNSDAAANTALIAAIFVGCIAISSALTTLTYFALYSFNDAFYSVITTLFLSAVTYDISQFSEPFRHTSSSIIEVLSNEDARTPSPLVNAQDEGAPAPQACSEEGNAVDENATLPLVRVRVKKETIRSLRSKYDKVSSYAIFSRISFVRRYYNSYAIAIKNLILLNLRETAQAPVVEEPDE